MERKEIKELIKLDAKRSKADIRGETKEYISATKKIMKLIKSTKK